MKSYFWIPVFIFFLVFSTSAIAGESTATDIGGSVSLESALDATETPIENARDATEEFGTVSWTRHWIPASAFQQIEGGDTRIYGGNGYYYSAATGQGNLWFVAPVVLPNGVDIWAIRLFFYDNGASNIEHSFNAYYGTYGWTEIDNQFTGGTPGYGNIAYDPIYIIDNNNNSYQIFVKLPASGAAYQFKGCRISYLRRQAPEGAQMFIDIPANQWYSQSVNNLARSGITLGCPDCPGCYCPNKYVTRAAMATFISRALGLHHGTNIP